MKNLVKIGIRPTIDGRRLGVRESLEDQTMNMANNLAKFIRHSAANFRIKTM
jgi:L-fucose isomerase